MYQLRFGLQLTVRVFVMNAVVINTTERWEQQPAVRGSYASVGTAVLTFVWNVTYEFGENVIS